MDTIILQWNIQSYFTKFTEIKSLLHDLQPACFCIQETLIRDRTAYPPSQYALIPSQVTRADDHERGTALLIHNRVHHEPIQLNTTLQAVAAKIYLRKCYTVCSLYLSPGLLVTQRDLEHLIDQLPAPFIVMGDFNAHNPLWHDHRLDQRGTMIADVLQTRHLNLLTTGAPTHYAAQYGTTSVIDLTICSPDCFLDFVYTVQDSLHDSDHYPIQLTLVEPSHYMDVPQRLQTKRANWPQFYELTELQASTEEMTVEELEEYLYSILMAAATVSIPRASGRLARPPVPWWNSACDDALRERKAAERKRHRRNCEATRIRYNRAKAICRRTFRAAKTESWKRYLSSISSRTPMSQIWTRIRKLSRKYRIHPTPVLLHNNTEISDPQQVAEIFAEHFVNISNTSAANPVFARHKQIVEAERIPTEDLDTPYNEPLQWGELQHALRRCGETSPGEDEITYSMLKHAHPTFVETLLHFYNQMFANHYFPDRWRTSIIIPFPKQGKDPKQVNNYRPISLTSCLSKILEKMINYRLSYVLETTGKILPEQSGFRRSRSTSDNLVKLETDLRNAMAHGQHTILVLYDLEKAYDTAWRCGVLRKLHNYGLRGHLYSYITNFLTDRRIKVRIGTECSQSHTLFEGIPQGSVLSCTCFLIAINDVTEGLPATVKSNIYVDDLVLYCSGRRPALLERQLQLSNDHLSRWCNRTGFRFSITKTESLHICRVRGCLKESPQLTMNNSILKHCSEKRYLGVTLDQSLTWRPHIVQLKRSCTGVLNFLRHITRATYGADCKTLLRLYMALLKPKLDYGCEAYASACPSLLRTLEPIQNAALRIATGGLRTSPVLSLQAITGIKPLHSFRTIKNLNYQLRLLAHADRTIYDHLDEGDPTPYMDRPSLPRPFLPRCGELLETYELEDPQPACEHIPHHPPWRSMPITVCSALAGVTKASESDIEMKQIFLEHTTTHTTPFPYYTDGSKTADGVACAAVSTMGTLSFRLPPDASIYTAELSAIKYAVEHASALQHDDIIIYTDSKSAIQGLVQFGTYDPIVNGIRQTIIDSGKSLTLCWTPSHVGIAGNEEADRAAKAATHLHDIQQISIPRADYRSVIKRAVITQWSHEWNLLQGNKLRRIQHSTKPLVTSCQRNRQWERILMRLRIGHTKLTHLHLVTGGPLPYCQDCLVRQSVEHLLIECPSLREQRLRCFSALPAPLQLEALLGDQGPVEFQGPLHQFLQSTELYDLL